MTPAIMEMYKKLTLTAAAARDAAKNDDITTTLRLYLKLRDTQEEVQELLDQARKDRDNFSYNVIPALFERVGVTSFVMKEGYRVTVQGLVRASTRDMAEGIQWCKDNDHEFLVKETINASTLAGYARSRQEEGKPDLPPEIFNVVYGMNTSVTRTKQPDA